jgi:hypothetical protein
MSANRRAARRSCVAARDFRAKRDKGRIVALALTRLVSAVGLIDDIEPPAPTNHAVVAMALAQRAERILDLHGKSIHRLLEKGTKQAGN